MSRRRTNDGNSPSTSGPNGLREFFTGPVHLLILKVPLLIIGTIFFVAYLIVKHTIIQTGRFIYSAITSIPSVLKSSMNYMISVYHKIPVYARYLGGWFHTKILLPIRFFVVNYLLSNTYRAIQWIGRTIVSLSVEFYRSILRPVGHFCCICAVERFPQWMDDILGALSIIIRLCFTKMSSLCLWLWHNVLHPFCSFIDSYLILPINRVVTKILSYICTDVVPVAAQFLKLMARAARHWLNQLILHRNLILLRIARFIRDMTMMLFQRILSPMYAVVMTAISYTINEIVVPCCQWTIQTIKTIAYHSFIALFRALIHISETIVRLCRAILHIGGHCWLWLHHTVRKIYTFMVDDFFPATILIVKRIARFIWACVYYLLRNMYLVSSELICVILDTTMLLYQRILSPMYTLDETAISYTINEIVVPMCRWMMQMVKAISYHSFIALSRALIHISETIIRLCRAILYIGGHCWLWLDHTVRKIYTFIVDDFFPATILRVKRMARFIWACVNYLLRNIYLVSSELICVILDTTMMLYQRILSPMFATVVTSISYTINEIVVPCCQWTIQTIKTISYHFFTALFRALIHLSNLIMHIYYTVIFAMQRYRSSLYDMLRKIWLLFYHKMLPAGNQFMKRLMKTVWDFSNHSILYSRLILLQIIHFIRDSSTALYKQILLPLYGTVVTLTMYITKEILQPLGKWTIQMLSVASTAVVSIVHTVIQACYAAGLFCRHQGLQVCHTVVDACWLTYSEIMKMISALNMHIQPILRYRFYERIFHPIGGALYENGQIFYQSTLVPLGHAMSTMGPAIINLLNALKKMTSDGLYALRQAVVALSAALAAMFRATIESLRRLLAQ